MLLGLSLSLIAGSLVALQNIFNNKVNEHTGTWITTALVLGLGFLASLVVGIFFEGGNLFVLQNMKLWYWFSGIIGIGVVTCLVQGIKLLGPTYAVLIILASQLGFALLFDLLGLLGIEKVPFSFNQVIGVLVIIGGIWVFKMGGTRKKNKNGNSIANLLKGQS